jgi:hypothetical protein
MDVMELRDFKVFRGLEGLLEQLELVGLRVIHHRLVSMW